MKDPKVAGLAGRRAVVCALAAQDRSGAGVEVAVKVAKGGEVAEVVKARSGTEVRLPNEVQIGLESSTVAQVPNGKQVATAAKARSSKGVATAVQVRSPKEVATVAHVPSGPGVVTAVQVSSEPVVATTSQVSSEPVVATTSRVSSEPVVATTSRVPSEPVVATTSRVSSEPVVATTTSQATSEAIVTRTSQVQVSSEPVVTTTSQVSSEPVIATTSQVSSEPVAAASAPVPIEQGVATIVQVQTGAELPVKRKRGRPPKNHVKQTGFVAQSVQRKEEDEEEDVCFICFDGGDLVLCDRRGCPKAYHPACIKRDEAFFQSAVKWNCGWHICSTCQKTSHYMCYTCTYSLCKGCTRAADYFCVRGNKGFCGLCIRTVFLVENISIGNKERVQVDFDDRSSWEYLFKLYWTALKEKLSITAEELTKARNPGSGVDIMGCNGMMVDQCNGFSAKKSTLGISFGVDEVHNPKRRKMTEPPNSLNPEEFEAIEKSDINQLRPLPVGANWATKELMEFVAHMKHGDKAVLSQADVEALLQEYISSNNLRDPRQKNQIFCDTRLINLFGKTKLGYVEMFKLLESHFLDQAHPSDADKVISGVVQAVASELAVEGNSDSQLMENESANRPSIKVDDKKIWTSPDEYAIINVQNVNLIYLTRSSIENMLDDADKFLNKLVGSFIRVKILSSEHLHRLVQVTGVSKATEPYKIGRGTTDIVLEILNLNKKEVVRIDSISDQNFSEDECCQLCQSMKSGLTRRLTLGEFQEKAIALQSVKAIQIFSLPELKISEPNNLCHQASVNGDKKEQKEFIEKLQILSTPEGSQCMNEAPGGQVHSPMYPQYGSEGDTRQSDKNRKVNVYAGNDEMVVNHQIGIPQKELISSSARDDARRDIGNKDEIALSYTELMESLVDDSETDKIWHYRDPCGKVQGPFPMMMLRRWSIGGYFPPELRIWRISGKECDSILLTDAMRGQFGNEPEMPHVSAAVTQKVSDDSHGGHGDSCTGISKEMNSEHNVTKNVDATWCSLQKSFDKDKKDFACSNESGHMSSPIPVHVNPIGGEVKNLLSSEDSLKIDNRLVTQHQSTFSGNADSLSQQLAASHGSEGWNSGLINVNVNLNEATEEQNILEQEKQDDQEQKPVQSSGQSSQSSPINSSNRFDLNFGFVSLENHLETSEHSQKIDFPTLHCPTPKSSGGDLKGQVIRTKELMSLSVPVPHSHTTWSDTSSLVDGSRIQQVPGEWNQYSDPPAKPTVKEWSLNIVSDSSDKRSEMASDHSVAPTSGSSLLIPSPTHPTTDWQAIVNDPNDFTCLVDESVSDLLAEVEAMESLYALASPTSKLRLSGQLTQGSGTDCFSPIITPVPDPGTSDALTSSSDLHMACHSTVMSEASFIVTPTEALNAQKRSGGHSSTSTGMREDSRLRDGSFNHCNVGLDTRLSLPSSASWGVVSNNDTRPTVPEPKMEVETSRINWGQVQEDVHFDWGGLSQGAPNPTWAASHGISQEVNRTHSRRHVSNGSHLQTQQRHSGSRDRDFLGRDSSFGRSRPSSLSRQPHGGANADIAFRTPPRGQRVCKFHESGYCKKGESCSYWHPS